MSEDRVQVGAGILRVLRRGEPSPCASAGGTTQGVLPSPSRGGRTRPPRHIGWKCPLRGVAASWRRRRIPTRRRWQHAGAGDDRGSTAIEFALVLPVVLLMMLGIVEYGLYLFATSVLQDALAEAARFGITGRTLPGVDRTTAIRRAFERRLVAPLDPAHATFETLVYPDFASIGRPEPFEDRNGNGVRDPGEPFDDVNGNGRWDADMGLPGVGGPDSVVLYRVRYPWRPFTPLFRPFFGTEGVEIVTAVAVRNEPFPGERG